MLLALLVGLVAAPLAALVAFAVRLSVGRPIFFTQTRAGLGGAAFEILKFRTMLDLRDGSGTLLPDSRRVTRIGHLLRRTRLDELPELINILRGEMSFVGPRPLLPETIAAFGAGGIARGRVRPGLTGWAQVNGNTLLTSEEKLELDLWYVANRSFVRDLAILVRTIGVMILGERRNDTNLEKAIAGGHHRGC
ncbi:sugar transferase [Sphingosinicella sp. BN140058]|nr:sugar transferase [Sphingosinicella sp. BN140058]